MEQKDMYTLEELYDNLPIALSELARRSEINEVTLARIRDGFFARRSTVVKLLMAFSKVYGFQLSLSNVTGILIRDKKALGSQLEKSHTAVTEQGPVLSTSNATYDESSQTEEPQNRNVEPSEGDMLLNDFAKMSGIPIRTLCNWKDASPPKIEVISHKRYTGGGFEYFISPEQQEKAIELRKRYPGKKK